MKGEQSQTSLQQYLSLQTRELPSKSSKGVKNSANSLVQQNGSYSPHQTLIAVVDQIELFTRHRQTYHFSLLPDEALILAVASEYLPHQSIPFAEWTKRIIERLPLSTLNLLNIVKNLLLKGMIDVQEHSWKGLMVRVTPLWRQEMLGKKVHSAVGHTLVNYELLSTQYNAPMEKQLIFMFYVLKNAELLLNKQKRLHKTVVSELREKLLKFNPAIAVMEAGWLNSPTQLEAKFKVMSNYCDDIVVQFVLEIAFQMGCIKLTTDKLIWHEQNFLDWVVLDVDTKQLILKLLVSAIIAERTDEKSSTFLNQIIALNSDWNLVLENREQEKRLLINFAQSCGWIDAISNEHHVYVRQRVVEKEIGNMVRLPNLSVLCFEDCQAITVWHLLHIARVEQMQEVIVFHLDVKKIVSAQRHHYTFSSIEKIFDNTDERQLNAEWNGHWERLKELAMQNVKCEVEYLLTTEIGLSDEGIENKRHLSSLGYAVGTSQRSTTLVEDMVLKLLHQTRCYPDIWFERLTSYSTSLVKTIIELAFNIGLSLEVQVAEQKFHIIVNEWNGNEYFVYRHVISQSQQQCDNINLEEVQLPLSDIQMIRLIREY